ncbi:SRPBCC family protein [Mycolicibacterium sp. XJ870]
MEFINQFVVPAPIEQAWTLLNDVPAIAPCLPGAQVRPLEDGTYEGTVTVKVGPIKVGYQGLASFTETDPERHLMVLDARGAETSGKGTAAAVVRVTLSEKDPDTTLVEVLTDLQVTGRIAQFGRSVMADVGARIIGQFATNLEQLISAGAPESQGGTADFTTVPTPSTPNTQTAAPAGGELDLLSLGLPLFKKAAPAAGALLVGLVIGRLLPRRRNPISQPSDASALYPLLLELARASRCTEDTRLR